MTPAAGERQAPARLAALDGLRAVAAGSVLVYHVWRFGDPGGGLADAGPLAPVLPHLWHGVTLFFVLSGFLLYRPFAAAVLGGGQRPSVRRYLRSRALRILPAYWVVLLVTAFVLQSAMVADGPGPRAPGVPDAELLAINLVLLQNASPSTIFTGVGPAWSLVVELCFYLTLPLLGVLALARSRGAARPRVRALAPALALLAVGISGKLAALAPGGWDLGMVRSFWALADLFGFGMLVAVASVELEAGRLRLPRRWRTWAASAIAAIAGIGLATGATHMAPTSAGTLAYTSLAGAACALLVGLVVCPARGQRRSRLVACLERPWVAGAGLVSYSAFLWHEPLLRWLHANGLTLTGGGGFAVNVAVTTALTGVLAVVTYQLVEVPARHARLHPPRVAAALAGGTAARMSVLVVCVFLATMVVAGCASTGASSGADGPSARAEAAVAPARAEPPGPRATPDSAARGDGRDDGSRAPRTRFTRIPGVTTATALGPLGAEGLRRWRREVPRARDVRIRSTADGTRQPALWLPSSRSGPRPLLVVLHSWSNGYTQHLGIPYARWAQQKGWAMIAPHFRGVNDKPAAAGSERAVQDVVDAIDHAVAQGSIDERRVFVVGFSGGGMMSLLMAGRHPERIAGAVSWVPVHDLRLWYAYNTSFSPPRDYARHIRIVSGGEPTASAAARAEAARRSPSAYLARARRAGVPVFLGHGLQDTLVLPTHAARAFNQLADPADRIGRRSMRSLASGVLPAHLREREAATYFGANDPRVLFSRRSGSATLVLFEGQHDMVFNPGLEWMTRVGWRRGGA